MSLFYKKTAGLALCTLFSASSLFAQQSITGIVSDANGPISGATVSKLHKVKFYGYPLWVTNPKKL